MCFISILSLLLLLLELVSDEMTPAEIEMMNLMGFSAFESTKVGTIIAVRVLR